MRYSTQLLGDRTGGQAKLAESQCYSKQLLEQLDEEHAKVVQLEKEVERLTAAEAELERIHGQRPEIEHYLKVIPKLAE